ncbi:hypothetical protein CAI16_17910 [Virgibacillus dokdonensis]|uniref:Uncharacterized protein n=1 Tax=Virgibacillus dokdonensis TaxID=302167 RepID=A0A3E0WJZ9_9BACI|nr:hypothetical protein [Virgibacillus dokdonensis]RFA32471.1 hypothetical protein CAI16_17910 [Virgibacillus dokdonensis]
MLISSKKEIRENYFMLDAIKDLKQGLQAKNNAMIKNPHRTVIHIPTFNGSDLYMPSADVSSDIASVKEII